MGITQWVQTKMNPAPGDPVQAKMFALMPVIFTFMFAAFPSGLVIYYTWNNLLSVAQQYYHDEAGGRADSPVREPQTAGLCPEAARRHQIPGGRVSDDGRSARRGAKAVRRSVRFRLGLRRDRQSAAASPAGDRPSSAARMPANPA